MGNPGVLSLGVLRERVTLGRSELGTVSIHAQLILTTTVTTPQSIAQERPKCHIVQNAVHVHGRWWSPLSITDTISLRFGLAGPLPPDLSLFFSSK